MNINMENIIILVVAGLDQNMSDSIFVKFFYFLSKINLSDETDTRFIDAVQQRSSSILISRVVYLACSLENPMTAIIDKTFGICSRATLIHVLYYSAEVT